MKAGLGQEKGGASKQFLGNLIWQLNGRSLSSGAVPSGDCSVVGRALGNVETARPESANHKSRHPPGGPVGRAPRSSVQGSRLPIDSRGRKQAGSARALRPPALGGDNTGQCPT